MSETSTRAIQYPLAILYLPQADYLSRYVQDSWPGPLHYDDLLFCQFWVNACTHLINPPRSIIDSLARDSNPEN